MTAGPGAGSDWAFEADDHFAEQFPLSPLDDHLIHQTPDPMRIVASTDPRFFERHWNVFHDQTGDLLVVTGGSFYPNLDTAEAFAIVTHKGVQRSVRAFRPIGANRGNIQVGPIRPTVLEGMRRWRHELAANAFGIAYDLDWRDSHRQVYRAAYGSLETGSPSGGQRHVTAGFEGFGTVSGWVEIAGERHQLTGRGTRDRHWGIGRGVGGPRFQPGGGHPRPAGSAASGSPFPASPSGGADRPLSVRRCPPPSWQGAQGCAPAGLRGRHAGFLSRRSRLHA
ncbi:hypothetical protein ACFSTD_19430 [Novosphingobium colocasiae]